MSQETSTALPLVASVLADDAAFADLLRQKCPNKKMALWLRRVRKGLLGYTQKDTPEFFFRDVFVSLQTIKHEPQGTQLRMNAYAFRAATRVATSMVAYSLRWMQLGTIYGFPVDATRQILGAICKAHKHTDEDTASKTDFEFVCFVVFDALKSAKGIDDSIPLEIALARALGVIWLYATGGAR